MHTTSMILVSIPYRIYGNSVFEMSHPKRKTKRNNTLFKMNNMQWIVIIIVISRCEGFYSSSNTCSKPKFELIICKKCFHLTENVVPFAYKYCEIVIAQLLYLQTVLTFSLTTWYQRKIEDPRNDHRSLLIEHKIGEFCLLIIL